MKTSDLTCEASWTAKFDGNEQHAQVPLANGSPLKGEKLTVLVVREKEAFSQKDRDHAQRLVNGLDRCLRPALDRMMRHLDIADLQTFLDRYCGATILLTAGDYTNWSLAFDPRSGAAGIFCDWHGDEIARVWVAD